MLVFLSDVHLTDGSSGATIKPAAFRVFAENLRRLADTVAPLEEINLVLLGDIFDISRSTQWLSVPVRPWDAAGPEQERVVANILQEIISTNRQALRELLDLGQYAQRKKVPFNITYVIGNHDWLINRYNSCIKMAAAALGIGTGDISPFPEELFAPNYQVFARHGDIYDRFNYTGNRDSASIGDAMVIELLNKYPQQVNVALSALVDRGDATPADKDKITTLLKELDNVRPLLDAPSWIFMVTNKTENVAARQAMENVWDACVDAFFQVPFIKEQDKFLWPDSIDMLQIALKLSSHTSKKLLEKIAAVKEKLLPEQFEGGCHKKAFTEPKVRSGEAKFVLYGHTHHHVIVSMDQVPLPNGLTLDKIYFNTGTWRKTWNRALCDPWNREFIDWHVLTYVAVFKPTENGSYSFEAWNGALG